MALDSRSRKHAALLACLLSVFLAAESSFGFEVGQSIGRSLLQVEAEDEEAVLSEIEDELDFELFPAMGPEEEPEEEAEAPGPEPEIIEKLCSGEVVFFLDAKFNWTADRHPFDYPDNARWSPIYGAVHNDLYEMYSFSKNASDAVEQIAEEGSAKLLKAEVEECIEAGNCREFLEFKCDERSGDCRAEGNFTVNSTFSIVSFITRVTPSPDWFTGVASLDLCNDGAWLPGVNIGLNASDAGTDAGTTFKAEDLDIPKGMRGNITELDKLNATNPFFNPNFTREEEEKILGEDGLPLIGGVLEVVSFSLEQDAETADLDVSGTGGAVATVVDLDDLTEEEKEELAKEEAKIRIVGPLNGGEVGCWNSRLLVAIWAFLCIALML